MAQPSGVVRRPPTDTNDQSNPYNVDMLAFPPDIAWTRANENYVIFYINVPDATASAGASSDYLGYLQPIEDTTLGAGRPIIDMGKPYRRLKAAICLPIMEKPIAKYAADWDMAALGPVLGWALTHGFNQNYGTGLVNDAEQAYADAKKIFGAAGDALKAVGLSILNKGAEAFGVGEDVSTKDIYSILTRTAVNEHRTQIFKSIRFRNFDFEYHFSPTDSQQAATIKKIIQTFKYHMHPDKSKENLFLTYPSEFDIVFYFQGNENSSNDAASQNLFKISTCAMTDFQVDYGGDKFFTFEDGMPTEIGMRMSFMELELMTKPRIAEGF